MTRVECQQWGKQLFIPELYAPPVSDAAAVWDRPNHLLRPINQLTRFSFWHFKDAVSQEEGSGTFQTRKEVRVMKYAKPRLIAKSQPQRSFAAGCPAKNQGDPRSCQMCDRAR
jgi:hypothetical protein